MFDQKFPMVTLRLLQTIWTGTSYYTWNLPLSNFLNVSKNHFSAQMRIKNEYQIKENETVYLVKFTLGGQRVSVKIHPFG